MQKNESDSQTAGLHKIIRDLIHDSNGDITACAAMSSDGYIRVSELREGVDGDRFAAMGASLLALADNTSSEIEIGDMRQVMIMGTTGVVILTHAGRDTVLAISAVAKAKLGKVLLDTKRAAQKFEELLN